MRTSSRRASLLLLVGLVIALTGFCWRPIAHVAQLQEEPRPFSPTAAELEGEQEARVATRASDTLNANQHSFPNLSFAGSAFDNVAGSGSIADDVLRNLERQFELQSEADLLTPIQSERKSNDSSTTPAAAPRARAPGAGQLITVASDGSFAGINSRGQSNVLSSSAIPAATGLLPRIGSNPPTRPPNIPVDSAEVLFKEATTQHSSGLHAAVPALPQAPISTTSNVIYSGLKDIAISTDFAGVYLNLDNGATSSTQPTNWDINPFFGGSVVGTYSTFLPVRIGTNNGDAIRALGAGTVVDGGLTYSTGNGGSSTHMGNGAGQFGSGVEAYIGFKFTDDSNSGPYFGWMRVIFTGNTSAGSIRDWAYETGTTGATANPITTANITQATPVSNNSVVTLTAASGEAPNLVSVSPM